MSSQSTAELLEAWRKAQRAADAARQTVELAQQAADAASSAAEAARRVAENAGLTVDQADAVSTAAKDAYAERERQVARGANDRDTTAQSQRP